jgi:hypothetical protein
MQGNRVSTRPCPNTNATWFSARTTRKPACRTRFSARCDQEPTCAGTAATGSLSIQEGEKPSVICRLTDRVCLDVVRTMEGQFHLPAGLVSSRAQRTSARLGLMMKSGKANRSSPLPVVWALIGHRNGVIWLCG